WRSRKKKAARSRKPPATRGFTFPKPVYIKKIEQRHAPTGSLREADWVRSALAPIAFDLKSDHRRDPAPHQKRASPGQFGERKDDQASIPPVVIGLGDGGEIDPDHARNIDQALRIVGVVGPQRVEDFLVCLDAR